MTSTQAVKSVLVMSTPAPTNMARTVGTSVFNFSAVQQFLSQKPLRHKNHLEGLEDAYDLEAIERSKHENVFFAADDIWQDLGLN